MTLYEMVGCEMVLTVTLFLCLVSTALGQLVSNGKTILKEGESIISPYNKHVAFTYRYGGSISLEIDGVTYNEELPLFSSEQQNTYLKIEQDGALQAYNENMDVVWTNVMKKTRASPFILQVDGDMRATIRDRDKNILWKFPDEARTVTYLQSDGMGYMRTGDTLVSNNGKYYFTIDPRGQIVTYTGEIFNRVASQRDEGRVLTVDENGSLILFDEMGRNRWDAGSRSNSRMAPFVVYITDVGTLVVYDKDSNEIWKRSLVPIPTTTTTVSTTTTTTTTTTTIVSTTTTPTPTLTPDPPKNFNYLFNPATKKCIGWSGDNIILWDCGAEDQKWSYEQSTGYFRNKKDSNICLSLDIETPGSPIKPRACNEKSAWTYENSFFRSKKNSELCIDNSSNKNANGNSIIIWSCNQGTAQTWNSTPLVYDELSNSYLRGCVDYDTSKGKIYMADCNGNDVQKWALDNGRLFNKGYNQCLTSDMSLSSNCAINTWDFNRGSGRIRHLPTDGSLDAGEGLYIYKGWINNNAWQQFGDRTKWVTNPSEINSICVDLVRSYNVDPYMSQGTLPNVLLPVWNRHSCPCYAFAYKYQVDPWISYGKLSNAGQRKGWDDLYCTCPVAEIKYNIRSPSDMGSATDYIKQQWASTNCWNHLASKV